MSAPHTLPSHVRRGKKRIGRGMGSGKGGHTVGRGQKGQKSRERIGISFFGTKVKKSLLKRIPMLRGKGKLKPHEKPVIIPLRKLDVFRTKARVDRAALVAAGLLKSSEKNVKIVGGGTVNKSLTIALPVSRGVRRLIEAQGGMVEL